MQEYQEGERAFWNGLSLEDNPYQYVTALSFGAERTSNWRLGWLYAKSMSLAREEETQ